MKRHLISAIIMIAFHGGLNAQQVEDAHELDGIQNQEGIDVIKVRSVKDLKPFMVDKKREYSVQDEGTEFIDHNARYITQAALDVSMTDRALISYTDARLRTDTLDILVHDFDESHSHNFQIRIVAGQYAMLYDFSYPIDAINRRIETLSSKLILNTGSFRRGESIRGYVEYSGKCVQGCEYTPGLIVAKGNFVVLIR
jgi:hypothetical protein